MHVVIVEEKQEEKMEENHLPLIPSRQSQKSVFTELGKMLGYDTNRQLEAELGRLMQPRK